jgi:hypothetical protein
MKSYAEPAPALDAGVELGEPEGVRLKSVIVPQDFLPHRSSDWARLHFAGCKTGYELVVGRIGGVIEGVEAHAVSPRVGEPGGLPRWSRQRRRPENTIWLRGLFVMTARLDFDEFAHAYRRDPELANARGWAPERGRCPGLVKEILSAHRAILPWAFTQHVGPLFDAGAEALEFDIDVCLEATGKSSPSSSPYKWMIVSWILDGGDWQAFRLRSGRPPIKSPLDRIKPWGSADNL